MKNKKALGLLLAANVVSGFAQGISMLAIPWYFTAVAGKASLFALIYASATFISLFWNLYAGTLIDRYPRKSIFIYVSLVCGAILLSISTTGYILGTVPLGLAGVVFVTTILNYNIHFGALYAFGQELTDPSQYGKISSYLEIQNQATSVLSGAFAAILLTGTEVGKAIHIAGIVITMPFTIPKLSLQDIFLMDGITYLIAVMLVAGIRYNRAAFETPVRESVTSRIRAGIEFLKKNPALFSFGNYSFAIFVVLLVQIFMLLPQYVNNYLERGSDVFASSEVFYSLGAMLAGMFIRRLFGNMNTVLSIITLMLITTFILFLVAFTKVTGIFYFFSFAIGITNAGTRVLRTTFLFNHVSNKIIGRTNSVFNVINILLRSSLLLVFSIAWFSRGSNITWAYFICGIFVLVSALLLMRNYKRLGRIYNVPDP